MNRPHIEWVKGEDLYKRDHYWLSEQVKTLIKYIEYLEERPDYTIEEMREIIRKEDAWNGGNKW